MDNVQRRGSPARMNYIKRFLAVLMCCVLVFCFIPAPQPAQAIVPLAIVAGVTIVGAIGAMILAAIGVDFTQSMVGDSDTLGGSVYEVGEGLMDTISDLTEFDSWYDGVTTLVSGGTLQGKTIDVPAEVAEYARTWATTNYDFSSGTVTLTDSGILGSNGDYVAFTIPQSDYAYASAWASGYVGTQLDLDSVVSFTNGTKIKTTRTYSEVKISVCATDDSIIESFVTSGWDYTYILKIKGVICLNPTDNSKFLIGLYDGNVDKFVFNSSKVANFSTLGVTAQGESMNMTPTEALDTTKTKDMVLAPPVGATYTDGVPALQSVTATDVVGAETGTETGTDTTVGDLTLTQEGIDSLGALMITKFPFSIPWDFARAVGLLAAPAQVPHWEVDFMAPLADRVGGWEGSTAITIDLTDFETLAAVCRWMETIMFCAGLAMATKRLLWTA